jgi:hypothetical protein
MFAEKNMRNKKYWLDQMLEAEEISSDFPLGQLKSVEEISCGYDPARLEIPFHT